MISYVHALVAYSAMMLVIGGYLGYVWHGVVVTPKLVQAERQKHQDWIRQRDEVISALQKEQEHEPNQ